MTRHALDGHVTLPRTVASLSAHVECHVSPRFSLCAIRSAIEQAVGRQSEVAIETIRAFLLSALDPLDEVNQSADPSRDEALADAVYVILRGNPKLDVAVDGWSMFQVVHETITSLKAVGIMTLIPSGELPMELEFSRESNATRYRLRMSLVDEVWYSLSESKRWKAVYLYATQGRDLDWPWAEPISGQWDDGHHVG